MKGKYMQRHKLAALPWKIPRVIVQKLCGPHDRQKWVQKVFLTGMWISNHPPRRVAIEAILAPSTANIFICNLINLSDVMKKSIFGNTCTNCHWDTLRMPKYPWLTFWELLTQQRASGSHVMWHHELEQACSSFHVVRVISKKIEWRVGEIKLNTPIKNEKVYIYVYIYMSISSLFV